MAWLTGYTYRKKGAVNSTTAGAQTNYQLKLVVGESSGASGEDVDCESHCLDFHNDIRFTKEDGTTKHDYWIDTSSLSGTTPNRKVDVWIEVASIPASGSVEFYMYYCKASDSSESSGNNSFPFFDDFGSSETLQITKTTKDNVHLSSDYCMDPNMCLLHDGTWFVVFREGSVHTYSSSGKARFVKSINNGGSWSSPSTIYDTANKDDRQPNVFEFQEGGVWTILVAWTVQTADPIDDNCESVKIIKSINGGTSWGTPVTVTTGDDMRVTGNPIQMANDNILLPLTAYVTGKKRNKVAISDDDGDNWTIYNATDHYADSRCNEWSVVEYEAGKLLGITRNQAGSYFNKITSTNYGVTWASPVLTNVPSPKDRPHLILLQSGDIALTYAHTDDDYRIVISSDNGVTWGVDDYCSVYYESGIAAFSGYPASIEYEENKVFSIFEIQASSSDEDIYGNKINIVDVKWDVAGAISVSNGIVHLDNDDWITGKTAFGNGYCYETRAKANEQDTCFVVACQTHNVWNDDIIIIGNTDLYPDDFDRFFLDFWKAGSQNSVILDNWNDFRNVYYHYRIKKISNSKVIMEQELNSSTYTNSTYITTENLKLALRVWDSSQESQLDVDFALVRKYADPEPTWGTWQSEDTSDEKLGAESGVGVESGVINKGYEDFTTFTEVDVGADRIQKTIHHIDHLSYRNEETYVYKDYGADFFGDFTHKIKVRTPVAPDDYSYGCVWALTNDLGDMQTLRDANKSYINIFLYRVGSDLITYLRETHNGTTYQDNNTVALLTDWRYIKIIKSGTSLTAYIYSDAEYSTLVDTLTLTMHVDGSYRHLYGCSSLNDAGIQSMATDIENFDIGEIEAKTDSDTGSGAETTAYLSTVIPSEQLLDSMDATTGWSTDGAMTSITVNTTTKQEGTGALNLIKANTTTPNAGIIRSISSENLTSKYVKVWLYLKDITTKNKIASAEVNLIDSTQTTAEWHFPGSSLSVSWNLLIVDTETIPDYNENPDLTNITEIQLYVNTNQATDTYAEGDVIADYYHYSGFDISDSGSGTESGIVSKQLIEADTGSGVDALGARSFCVEDSGIGEESFPPVFGTYFNIIVADGTSTKEETIPDGSRYGNIYISEIFLKVPALSTASKTARLEILTERDNVIISSGNLDASTAKSYSFHNLRALKGATKYKITTDANVTGAKAFEIEFRGLRTPYSLTEVGLSDDDTGSGTDIKEDILKVTDKTGSDIGIGEESFPPVFGTYFNIHVADGTSTKEETIPSDSRYGNIYLSSIFLKVPALSTPQKTARLELITERGNIVYSTGDIDASTAKGYNVFIDRALKGATKYKITTDANVTGVKAFEIEFRGLRTLYSLTEIEASDSDNDTGGGVEASSFSYRDCVSADNGSAIESLGSREFALGDTCTGIDVGERRYPPAESRGYYYAKIGSTIFRNLNKDSFRITEELNKIPSFEFEISNSAANRAAITAGITDILRIYHRHDSSDTLMFTGIINGDAIEYLSLERIRLVGYASYIDLNWRFHQHLNAEDAEDVGKCFVYSGSYSDKTTAANNDTINDVTITFSSVNDAIYIGQAETFFGMQVKYSTKGVQAANTTVIWEYSEGSSVWSTLDVLDETRQFTQDTDTYYITIPHKPSDWAKETVNSVKKFWIRARLTAGSYSTQPKLDRIKMMNIDPYRVYYFDTAASTIMDEVLDGTGYSMDVTDACPSDTISIVAEYETKLRMIAGVANALTWDDSGDKRAYQWWVDTSKKVHFKQKRGSTLGDITKELTILNNVQDYFNLSNRLHFLGNYDGLNQLRAVIENTDSQDTHEIRELAVPEERYNNYIPLKEAAQKAMTYTKAPLQKIAATVTTKYWLDEGFEVGDTVTLKHARWNVDETAFQIVRADIGPRVTNLDMGISQEHLDGLKAGLQRQLDISGIRMHGSTSLLQFGPETMNYHRVDATTVYPARLKIEVPSDARYIHKVLLSWTIGNFRADVGPTTGTGGGHDHTGYAGAGGEHDHTGFAGSGGAFTPEVMDAGVHTPVSLSSAHVHEVHGTIPYETDGQWGYLTVSEWSDYESVHTHSNPYTGMEPNHSHSFSDTSGGPSGTTSACVSIGYGTSCTSGSCVDPSSTYFQDVASAGHTHYVSGTTGSDGGHDHSIGSTGAGSSHRHRIGYAAQYDHYITDITFGTGTLWTSELEDPAHIHDMVEVPDHSTPGVYHGPHTDHGIVQQAAHSNHVIFQAVDFALDVLYQIYEVAAGTVMELIVNGETVGSNYEGAQTDIRIDGYMQTGTNTVEIQPIATEVDKKGGATMKGDGILFIEPKKF